MTLKILHFSFEIMIRINFIVQALLFEKNDYDQFEFTGLKTELFFHQDNLKLYCYKMSYPSTDTFLVT